VANSWLAQFGVGDLAERRAAHLSGGQGQRVALARALAAQPRVLLLDEPMAALDVDAASNVRAALRAAHRVAPRTTLLVTHDILDAVLLADRVVVLANGRVAEDGPANQVLTHPRTRFAARLAGLNALAGRVTAVAPDAGADRAVQVTLAGTGARVTGIGRVAVGTPALVVFTAQAVAVHREPTRGSPRNVLPGLVESIERTGPLLRIRIALAGRPSMPDGAASVPSASFDAMPVIAADLTPAAVLDLGLEPGDLVWLAIKAAEVRVHPA
jgi:molybdate transport system permease protein